MKEHFTVLVTTTPTLHVETIALATRMARRANAVLLFLHVVPYRTTSGESLLYAAADAEDDAVQDQVRARTPTDPSVRFTHRILSGEPEEVVARFVREHHVDMVIAEEPARGRLSARLWEGLAERLIRHVPCPVLIGGPAFHGASIPRRAQPRAPRDDASVAQILNAVVESRVHALRCWMDHATDSVVRIARSRALAGAPILAEERLEPRMGQGLRVQLEEHRRALRAIGWQLTVGSQRWSSERAAELANVNFLVRVREQGHATSLPRQTAPWPDRLVVLAGAVVPGTEATLVFAYDADDDFLRILGQPGPLPTFESYAFDSDGLMLSNSRFPDHLSEAGLLPAEDWRTPLFIRVAEPAAGPRHRWPLTRAAQQATHHLDGFDTRGYPDYRGTTVVGAWRWVEEYRFGVTAEVDRAVAFG